MKIRRDFVTNSSSVSHIITVPKAPPVEDLRVFVGTDARAMELYREIHRRLSERAVELKVDEYTVLAGLATFETDDPVDVEQIDEGGQLLSQLSERDLWSYLFHKYIFEQKPFHLVGAAQVETY